MNKFKKPEMQIKRQDSFRSDKSMDKNADECDGGTTVIDDFSVGSLKSQHEKLDLESNSKTPSRNLQPAIEIKLSKGTENNED